MKNIILFSLIFVSYCLFAQNINIPDPNFKKYLTSNINIDTNKDGEIQVSEALNVKSLKINYINVDSLTGIEGFQNLVSLQFLKTKVNKKDLAINNFKKLDSLYLLDFVIENLFVENIDSLKYIQLQNNEFEKTTKNYVFNSLNRLKIFYFNTYDTINIRILNLPILSNLNINSRLIKKLTIENLPKLLEFNKDGYYSTDTLILSKLPNIITAYFESYYIRKFVKLNELSNLKEIKFTEINPYVISNLPKLEKITLLNVIAPKVTLNNLPELLNFTINNTNDESIDSVVFKDLPKLKNLEATGTTFKNLPIKELKALYWVNIDGCTVNDSLIIEKQPILSQLVLKNSKIKFLKIQQLDSLNKLSLDGIRYNKFLTINNLNSLTELVINNFITQNYLINDLPKLSTLTLGLDSIQEIIVTPNLNLNNLSTLTITNKSKINKLQISDLKRLKKLSLYISKVEGKNIIINNLDSLASWGSEDYIYDIDFSIFKNLKNISMVSNIISNLNFKIENLQKIENIYIISLNTKPSNTIYINSLKNLNNSNIFLNLSGYFNKIKINNCDSLLISYPSSSISTDSIIINNSTFRGYNSLEKLDYLLVNTPKYVDLNNVDDIDILNFNSSKLEKLKLNNLKKLKIIGFYSVEKLNYCEVDSLKLDKLTSSYTNIDPIFNFFKQKDIKSIEIDNGTGTRNYFDFSNIENLQTLSIKDYKIDSINLNNNLKLIDLSIQNCMLTKLDVSKNILKSLNVNNNLLKTITGLKFGSYYSSLKCASNKIENLDISNNSFNKLSFLDASNNLLNNIQIDKSNYLFNIDGNIQKNCTISGNPLRNFCLKGNGDSLKKYYLSNTINLLQTNNIKNCIISEDCLFSGKIDSSNIVKGNSFFDKKNDGCKNLDTIKYNIPYGINYGQSKSILLGNNGKYEFSLLNGYYSLYPEMINKKLFTITPDTFKFSFFDKKTPTIQNFCITPVGNQNDVDITVIPTTAARPGFNAKYLVKCTNKGNQLSSGKVNINYDDNVMNYISSTPSYNSLSTGLISWDYNLNLFETKSFVFEMKLNTPIDSIPLNGGEQLIFTGSISATPIDTIISDNVFTLNQTVINSYDPNDKTCLQGEILNPNLVGSYLDYIIRFENTGNGEAVNIIVKDVIDTNRYDINSIIPIEGSHPYQMKVRGNIVEFIFENINLPYFGDKRYGFVAFKIKSKPNLVLGNEIKNKAEIYFDYNKAIITNEAITKVAIKVGNFDLLDDNSIKIYPNPATNFINIESVERINKLELFSQDGKLILVNLNPNDFLKLDSYPKGIYYLNCHTAKNKITKRIILE